MTVPVILLVVWTRFAHWGANLGYETVEKISEWRPIFLVGGGLYVHDTEAMCHVMEFSRWLSLGYRRELMVGIISLLAFNIFKKEKTSQVISDVT